jgi:hypothetical protein
MIATLPIRCMSPATECPNFMTAPMASSALNHDICIAGWLRYLVGVELNDDACPFLNGASTPLADRDRLGSGCRQNCDHLKGGPASHDFVDRLLPLLMVDGAKQIAELSAISLFCEALQCDGALGGGQTTALIIFSSAQTFYCGLASDVAPCSRARGLVRD